MSQVLDGRRAQMQELQKSEEDLRKVESQIEKVVYGEGLDFEYSKDSLRGLSESLNLELAGRGRVWKSGEISSNGGNRIFQFPSARVDHQPQMNDMILFAFSDRVRENDDFVYPVAFVGSFKVISDEPDKLELEPVFISDEQEYGDPLNTWTLYEKSPSDQRDAYIRDTAIVLDEDDPKLNEKLAEYRSLLVQQFIQAEMFGFDLSDPQQAREYEFIIDRIMFDGLPLVKIESFIESQSDRIAERFDPPIEEIFVRYRFDEKSNRPYQVDSSGNIETDGQFTKTGMAVDPSLHAGGEIEFQKGDIILVDQLTADGYQRGDEPVPPFSSSEPVTEVTRVFIRQLNDYAFLLKTLKRQSAHYDSELVRITQNNERSQRAIEETRGQLNMRDEAIEKLFADQEKFDKDLNTVRSYLDTVKLRKNDFEMKVMDLEKDIRSNQRRLRAYRRLLDRAEEETKNVSSTSSEASGADSEIVAPSTPPNN